jgi:hypothetical protein
MGNGLLFTLPNEIFEGRFNGFNMEDGHFKLLYTNGEYYEGSFKFGQRNANGQHYYKNGDYYDGEWQNDRRIGRGKVIFREGGKLTAMFIEDQADGYAEMEDAWGNVFLTENDEAKAKQRKGDKKNKAINLMEGKLQSQTGSVFHNQPGSFTNGRLYK